MKQVTPATSTTAKKVDASLDPILSLTQTCDYEGVSRWTIQRGIKAGTFPAGLELENGRPGWPKSWLKARRDKKVRRTLGTETAPAPEAADSNPTQN